MTTVIIDEGEMRIVIQEDEVVTWIAHALAMITKALITLITTITPINTTIPVTMDIVSITLALEAST